MNTFTSIKFAMLASIVAVSVGCQKSSTGSLEAASRIHEQKAATSERPVITGPQVSPYYKPVTLGLTIPADQSYVSATWDLGDGSALVQSLTTVTHNFAIGTYQVKATLVDANQNQVVLVRSLNILDVYDGLDCLVDATIQAPANGFVGKAIPASVTIPPCLANIMSSIRVEFGDGSAAISTSSGNHIYNAVGDYVIVAKIYAPQKEDGPFLVLSKEITITEEDTTPPNPLACQTEGETRTSYGAAYQETVACGLDGTKIMTYKVKTVEECRTSGGNRLWTEISKAPELQSEGECLGQSCRLPDGSILGDNQSRTLYTSQSPAGSCDSVAHTRTCNNGVLGGNSQAIYMSCNGGCGDFGPHGTVKTGVIVGEIQVPLTCSFGETGFFDLFHRVEDQTCNLGSVTSSNSRQGDIKSKGMCPAYSWEATANFSVCSADCGGTQNRIYTCKDNLGNAAPEERCTSARPVETRVCDGNPEAVRRTESSVVEEDGSSSATCPRNQIGVIVRTREVTTTKVFACINHSVQKESENKTYGPWVTENYCRDYVAHRCSQDSLTNAEARGRYKWMLKCRTSVPVIAEFLEKFEDVTTDGYSIDSTSRVLYPTFMNRAFRPEKPWIAPKTESASCNVPATVYIAAVCVSSCATPEQQIMAEVQSNKKMKYIPFIEALTANMPAVATLSKDSTINSHRLEKTAVEQWVTELIDTDHVILKFNMKSGRSLRLTTNHPVVAADGSMKLADTFKAGDKFVQLGGTLDEIVNIETQSYHGKVYNLFVKSSEPLKNIVVTNGYLNGTAFYQNEGASNMNRQLLKNKLTNGVFGK